MKLSTALASKGRRLGLAVLAAVVATLISPVAAPATPASAATPLCAGTFTSWWSPADITIRRSPAPVGRMDWNVLLTPTARFAFGPVLTVSIERAYVNGKQIASPYPGKTEVNTYDFHASLLNYNLIGRTTGGTIQTGDLLELYWHFQSNSAVGKASVICTVPAPGVG
jgi:hypothetical protein